MKIITTLCYSVIIAIFLPCTVFSESNYSDSGKVGLSFLTLAPSARIASLGGGGSAMMTGVSSLWSNPSLLAFADERAVQLTHTKWVEGINQELAAFSTATGFGTIGLSAQLFDSGDIDGRGEYGQSTPNETFDHQFFGFGIPPGGVVNIDGKRDAWSYCKIY